MIPTTTDSKVFDNGEGTTMPSDADAVVDQAGRVAGAEQWAARLARLDLDAESLEMIMAALTTDVCDEANATDA
jgi:hypothetical protein